jgi:hypothetical protein
VPARLGLPALRRGTFGIPGSSSHSTTRDLPLRRIRLILAMFMSVASTSAALAQSAGSDRVPEQGEGAACPPDVKDEAPTLGGGSNEPLSDKLAQSRGVICPPAGIDREMQVRPPGGGAVKVIPPPGTPGGDSRVEPR